MEDKNKLDKEQELALFENQKVVDVGMEKEVRKSFIEYSMSVIISRALPDVRDGMKPGQRRILYAMYEDGLVHSKPFRKSATTVGNVLGRYHPHGDAAVYGTMVRMAQPFSLRYPLIEGHGNFGSVDGDPPAAYRYTEARLDRIADEMMRDLDKNVVEMVPNFDNRLQEPSVLPSRFPNLLVNGSMGIAVGMATNIPPHNLGEVIDATVWRMEHPDCSVDELMTFIKGPDFPTSAIIYGVNGIKQAYLTGKGHFNMLAVVNNEPKVLNLTGILDLYIAHQEQVIIRRTQFDLDKARARAHIYEGYKIALDNIDEIVQIMKTSKSIPDSKLTLMERFGLDDVQAQAIVEMTLTGMERDKIEEELLRLHNLIRELEAILADEGKIKEIIKNEMTAIKEKYSDPRRTEIVAAEHEIILEDLIERHSCVITLTHAGYIKRQPADSYAAQNRGGKGIIGMSTKEEDFIENVIAVNSHSYLLMFTNTGRMQAKKAYLIPEAGRTAKGQNLVNILELQPGEKVTACIGVEEFTEGEYLVMVTRRGVIKRTLLSEYEYQRKGGKIALNLDEGDELLFVRRTQGDCELVLATRSGMATRFEESTVRAMGRTARGVKGISLRDDDEVVGVAVVEPGRELLCVTAGGFGKRSPFDDFRVMKNRGGYGVRCYNITEKSGPLVGVASVDDGDDLMLITDTGTIIRTPVSGIPTRSRSAGGVIVMRLGEGQTIANFTKVAHEEEKPEDASDQAETDTEAVEVTDDSALSGDDTTDAGASGAGTDQAGQADDTTDQTEQTE